MLGCGCQFGGSEYGAQFPIDAQRGESAGMGRDSPIYSAPLPVDAAVIDAPANSEASPPDAENDLVTALDAPLDVAQTVDHR